MDDGESGLEVGVGAVPHMAAAVMRGDVVGVVTAGVADMKHSMDGYVTILGAVNAGNPVVATTTITNCRGKAMAPALARASKKSKPKKIPQHGLDVVQLEQLRITEQKKMEGVAAMSMSRAAHLSGGGRPSHLLSMHPPTLPLSLSALPRPGADAGM
jgi:hypothetical protein